LPGSRDQLLNFGTPPNISGTVQGTNLKFCKRIDRKGY